MGDKKAFIVLGFLNLMLHLIFFLIIKLWLSYHILSQMNNGFHGFTT